MIKIHNSIVIMVTMMMSMAMMDLILKFIVYHMFFNKIITYCCTGLDKPERLQIVPDFQIRYKKTNSETVTLSTQGWRSAPAVMQCLRRRSRGRC